MSNKLESKVKENGFKYGLNYGFTYPLDCKDVRKLIIDYPLAIKEITKLKGPKRRERIGVLIGGTLNASIGYGLPLLLTGAAIGYVVHQVSQ